MSVIKKKGKKLETDFWIKADDYIRHLTGDKDVTDEINEKSRKNGILTITVYMNNCTPVGIEYVWDEDYETWNLSDKNWTLPSSRNLMYGLSLFNGYDDLAQLINDFNISIDNYFIDLDNAARYEMIENANDKAEFYRNMFERYSCISEELNDMWIELHSK